MWPSDEVKRDGIVLEPLLSLKSRIAYIKELDAGQEISYGGTFRTAHPMRVATIPVGYADGYPRGLSNKGDVLIAGKRARILGRVCMDQFMVDVTTVSYTHLSVGLRKSGRAARQSAPDCSLSKK